MDSGYFSFTVFFQNIILFILRIVSGLFGNCYQLVDSVTCTFVKRSFHIAQTTVGYYTRNLTFPFEMIVSCLIQSPPNVLSHFVDKAICKTVRKPQVVLTARSQPLITRRISKTMSIQLNDEGGRKRTFVSKNHAFLNVTITQISSSRTIATIYYNTIESFAFQIIYISCATNFSRHCILKLRLQQ